MVRKALIVLLMVVCSNSLANGTEFTPDQLRQHFRSSEQHQLSVEQRLKASRADPESMRLLQDKELFFRLPNDRFVQGVLLDNGKISPALLVKGKLVPACVTESNRLIPGKWDSIQNAIVCSLPRNERFAILDQGIAQIKDNASQPTLPKEQQIAQASKYTNPGELPPNETQEHTQGGKPAPAAQKYTAPDANKQNSSTEKEHASVPSYIYLPPSSRGSSRAKAVAGVIENNKKEFGISVGTWIQARLMRPSSSAERGMIEFEITETVFGKYRDLPEETVFFAQKYVNEAEQRMESYTVLARLPDGEEISINATVHALDQSAGLPGSLVRDRDGEVMVAGKNAALGLLAQTTRLSGESAAAQAVGDVTGDLIENESDYVPDRPKAIIRVSDQPCLLKITKTF